MSDHIDLLATHIQEQIHQSRQLLDVPLGLAIFGSARTPESDHWYQDAFNLAAIAAKHQVPVISGGGPGIMTAANRGAFLNDGIAVGLNIELPHEQHANEFQTHSLYFKHFPPRKIAFLAHSKAFAVYPGGFGTLDELFEVLTLVQTGKEGKKPVVLVDKQYWAGLIAWIEDQLVSRKMIHPDDVGLFKLVDSAEEAWEHVKDVLI
jgi:uncharacterized protein (TIGR00730 family)